MFKSGLIVAGVMLFLAIGVSLLSPCCVPCLAILAGAAAGYLAAVFDKPIAPGDSAQTGAAAGGIGGIGALIGHVIGGAINAVMVGPEMMEDILYQLGLPASSDPTTYYAGAIGGTCCFGVLEVALMAGLGALGGWLWFQTTGKDAVILSGDEDES
jgi:hypothetical protein